MTDTVINFYGDALRIFFSIFTIHALDYLFMSIGENAKSSTFLNIFVKIVL